MNALLQRLLALIITTTSLLAIVSSAGGVKVLAFDLFGPTCNNDKAKSSAVCTGSGRVQSDTDKNNVVLRTIKVGANIIGALAGAAAVIMIIVGAFSFVTSGGNSEKTQNARRRIINASVGLAIVVLAWTITRFITDKVL